MFEKWSEFNFLGEMTVLIDQKHMYFEEMLPNMAS